MKNRILNNWPLKLLALAIAFATWFIVVQVTDPQITASFTIPVQFSNEEVITGRGMVVNLVDEAYAEIRITKPRSVINSLSEEDFSAVADYSQMYRDTQVPINVYSRTSKVEDGEIELVNQSIEVSLESLEKVTKVVEYDKTGEPAAGYIVGNVAIEPTSIVVECPQSFTQYIKTAKVSIDVSGLSENTTVSAEVKLYDGNGDWIDPSKYKGLSIEGDGIVQCNIELLPVHTVPIIVDVADEDQVAVGCTFESAKTKPEKISIYGEKSVMQNVTEIHITGVSVKDLNETTKKEIDIRSFLPDGVSVYKDQYNVEVTLNITKAGEKLLTIPSGDVSFKNLSSDMNALIDGDTTIKVSGTSDSLSKITSSDIKASADLNGLGEGEHEIKLDIEIGVGGVTLVDTVSAKVIISKK